MRKYLGFRKKTATAQLFLTNQGKDLNFAVVFKWAFDSVDASSDVSALDLLMHQETRFRMSFVFV